MNLKSIVAIATLSLVASQTLFAQKTPKEMCDITAAPCWGDGKKCDIHFKNDTGLATGDSHGTYNQESFAATIKVEAQYYETNAGDQNVGNRLKILAGQKATMNLDKKVNAGGFAWIHVAIPGEPTSILDIPCEQIQRILEGGHTCHIWTTTSAQYDLAYSCNGGDQIGRGYYENEIDIAKPKP